MERTWVMGIGVALAVCAGAPLYWGGAAGRSGAGRASGACGAQRCLGRQAGVGRVPQPARYGPQLRPIAAGVMACLGATQRTLRAIEQGESMDVVAQTACLHRTIQGAVDRAYRTCARQQQANPLPADEPAAVRPVLARAARFEGLAALFGRYFIWAVTLPRAEARASFLRHMADDGAQMRREMTAFARALWALSGVPLSPPPPY